MLLYIMLHIVLAYLMLFAALTNAVCLNNALFFIDLCKCFLFSCFVFVYFIFLFASCTVHLICLFFLIICSHRCCWFFFISKGYELSGEIALKNNHYYYYYFRLQCEISILQVSVTLRTILLILKHEIILCFAILFNTFH